MSENCNKQCVEELCFGKSKQELQELIASEVGATVLGHTIACDREGCCVVLDTLSEEILVYGDCQIEKDLYASRPSSRTIPL